MSYIRPACIEGPGYNTLPIMSHFIEWATAFTDGYSETKLLEERLDWLRREISKEENLLDTVLSRYLKRTRTYYLNDESEVIVEVGKCVSEEVSKNAIIIEEKAKDLRIREESIKSREKAIKSCEESSAITQFSEKDWQSITPVVYRLLKAGEDVYIGETVNLYERIRSHKADKNFDKVLWKPAPDNKRARVAIERSLIKAYTKEHGHRPKYNMADH